MEEGTYTWPYYFKIPSDSPLSYCDNLSDVTYNLVAVVDTPVLVRAISQVSNNIRLFNIPCKDSSALFIVYLYADNTHNCCWGF